jgi:hypothetical protein
VPREDPGPHQVVELGEARIEVGVPAFAHPPLLAAAQAAACPLSVARIEPVNDVHP